jgi:hypothetical protein
VITEKTRVPASTVERLRAEMAERLREQAQRDDASRLQTDRDKDEGRQAGRAWATDEAGLEELERLASLQTILHDNKATMIGRIGPAGSPAFRKGVVEAALEVWEEVKDQL